MQNIPLSEEERIQVHEIIVALRGYRDKIEHIMNIIGDKRSVSREEKIILQGFLRELKESLKQAAKRGTVSDLNVPQNQFEKLYFAPAVSKASAYFLAAVNSHPIKSNWHSTLYDVRIEISYPLYQLETQFLTDEVQW